MLVHEPIRAQLLLGTYLCTMPIVCCRMFASSLSRCGLLPVFSSCSITPTTISSFMPSVSILKAPASGGGVASTPAATRAAFRGCSSLTAGGDDLETEVEETGDNGSSPTDECDRFIFLLGCCCSESSAGGVVAEAGGERWDDDRALLGTWMPSDVSDTDFRRVLYIMFEAAQTECRKHCEVFSRPQMRLGIVRFAVWVQS